MPYRLSDAREAERAIREFWRARASYAESSALRLENGRLRQELDAARAVNQALLGSKAIRVATMVKRVARRNRQPEQAAPAPQGPAFSVAMTVYNNGACVRESVASVLAQTLPDWELLIWDDGTTDPQTLAVLDEIDSPRVRILRSPNQGVVGARNSVAQQARGEFLMFLDPDDELRPTYLEKALITFRRFPGVDSCLGIPVRSAIAARAVRDRAPAANVFVVSTDKAADPSSFMGASKRPCRGRGRD